MKASSLALQSPQHPYTVYGMPIKSVALVLALIVPLVPILSGINIAALTFFIPLVFFLIGAGYLWVLRRREPHFESLFLYPRQFFKGRKTRSLIAGPVPQHLQKPKKHA
ncbi:hypothetical protein [Kiloniella laminariae]|uniref:hypothetical protein n=1 Tax=Kiloniella laminariae TaxID=454162 RepID=UPI00036CEAC6|nr:hypothetical protein [Kiloniella laminariae]